jgi:exosortase A
MNDRTALSPAWKQALPLLLGLIAWLIYWYWNTAAAMVDIWLRSETYTHAFVVPPITLWLIWRQRALIHAEQPRTSLLLAIPITFTTFAWLLGELTAVNALTQFALVATLVLAIMALLGTKVSKRIAFPLAFLFFSVPFGDFMMPKLMDWTAAFTVLALRASGIPVYQEGLQFVIPSGNWSVVEACSGIRYIIASVTIGTLFAYLNYTSLRRRLIFIGVAILVPIVANWLRAYMIVMLGHLSNNKLAAGVDHLIYGWVFFGVVIMIMFVIGARWAEPEPDLKPANDQPLTPPADSTGKAWLAALAVALIAAAGPLAFIAINKADQAGPVQLATLPAPDGWQESSRFADWKPEYANPSAELQSSYERDGKTVGVYIAYYRGQDYERKLVTSTNVLASTTSRTWAQMSRADVPTTITGLPAEIRRSELLNRSTSPETRLVVWQWYWINGHLTTSDARAKLYTALARLTGRGDDSAVVMLYAKPDESNGHDSPLNTFAAASAGQLSALLEAARSKR